jgi:rhodanese-related sulfurtransferase
MSLLHFDYSGLRRNLLEAVIIVCFGVGVGLSLNFSLLMQVFTDGQPAPPPPALVDAQQPAIVTRAQVEASADRALRVDARISELYAAGHLPGALSLPLDEIDQALPAFLRDVPQQRSLIIYCSGYGCPDSYDLGQRLREAGYPDVMIYEGGFPEWRDAGLPVETQKP